MKKLQFLILIFLINTINLFPQNNWYVKLGSNVSKINGTKTILKPGYVFGLGYEWTSTSNTAFAIELFYHVKNGMIKNKTIASMMTIDWAIYHTDILYSIGSVEIPFLIRQYLIKKNIKFYMIGGTPLSLGISDKSSK